MLCEDYNTTLHLHKHARVCGAFLQTDALMMFDKLRRRCVVGRNGRAKAGPYHTIRPAEAGAGRYRCPACDTIQIRRALARVSVRTHFNASMGRWPSSFAKILRTPSWFDHFWT